MNCTVRGIGRRLDKPGQSAKRYLLFGASDRRRPVNSVGELARHEQATKLTADEKREQIAEMQFYATWATSCMLPWERAQMNVNTTPLKTWEKIYWMIFPVLGVAGFAYEMSGSNNAVRKRFCKEPESPSSSALSETVEQDESSYYFPCEPDVMLPR